ncbi:MAG: DMT family transporter [Pseudomonadota bacterium]
MTAPHTSVRSVLAHALPMLALATAVLIFTGGFASARYYLEAGGSPQDVVTLRYGVSGLLFAIYVFARRRRLATQPGWPRAIALALTGGVPFGGFVFVGVNGAPFTHGGSIVPGITLLLGTLLAWAWLREPVNKKRLAGVVLTIAGLALLLMADTGQADVRWWGEVAYLAAGICWAVFTVLLRAFRVDPVDGAALAAAFSLPYLIVYGLWLNPQILAVPASATLVHGLYQGVLFNMVAILLYASAVSRLGAAAAVAAMTLMPLFAVALEWTLFDRLPHWIAAPALMLMGVGITLAALAAMAAAPPPHLHHRA